MDFHEKIEQEFEQQTSEQLQKLVNQCNYLFRDDVMIRGIISNINKTKTVSFNQWKALKAHLSKHNNPKKKI